MECGSDGEVRVDNGDHPGEALSATESKEGEEDNENSAKKRRERQRTFPNSNKIKDHHNVQRISLQSMNKMECMVGNGAKLGGEMSVDTMGGAGCGGGGLNSPGQRG